MKSWIGKFLDKTFPEVSASLDLLSVTALHCTWAARGQGGIVH